jgi:hypothetical protein
MRDSIRHWLTMALKIVSPCAVALQGVNILNLHNWTLAFIIWLFIWTPLTLWVWLTAT